MCSAFALVDDTRPRMTGDGAKALEFVPAGIAFGVPPVLFAKITEDDLEAYRDRFDGEKPAGAE